MLVIIVPGKEYWDEEKNVFVTLGDTTLHLEHSLVSLSKWEAIFEKPLLGTKSSSEEAMEYIKCMILEEDYDSDILLHLSEENHKQINDYINQKMTATWFNENPNAPKNHEVITAELIYYWLFSFNIPLECEHWHLSRLFTLLRVFGAKNSPPKKMSPAEVAARQRELNAQRRQRTGSSG